MSLIFLSFAGLVVALLIDSPTPGADSDPGDHE